MLAMTLRTGSTFAFIQLSPLCGLQPSLDQVLPATQKELEETVFDKATIPCWAITFHCFICFNQFYFHFMSQYIILKCVQYIQEVFYGRTVIRGVLLGCYCTAQYNKLGFLLFTLFSKLDASSIR